MTPPGTFTLNLTPRGDREIVITRAFRAPRQLVFDAHTKPELLKRWLGAFGGWSLPVCEIDLRVGGKYRYVWRNEELKKQMGAGGIYLEIVPPERLVCTEMFDDPWYPGESLITNEFAEAEGITTLTLLLRYATPEGRDGVLNSGMERGLSAGYNAMDALLQELAA